MSKLNLLISLLAFDDPNTTNDPQMAHVDWTRNIKGFSVNNPASKKEVLAPGESLSLLNGVRSTSIDGTTQFDLSNTIGSTYRAIYDGNGSAPVFRTERALAADATTGVTITKNNNATTTFTASAGTLPDFSSVLIGDKIRIGAVFSISNQGTYTIIAKTATTITIKKADSVAESVVLGAAFAQDFRIYSASGVQIGDKVIISAGFSPATQDTYEISDVAPDFIEFLSGEAIPEEVGVIPGAAGMIIYSDAKNFVYIECDKKCLVKTNGNVGELVEPQVSGSSIISGIYLKLGTAFQVDIENTSLDPASIIHITAE